MKHIFIEFIFVLQKLYIHYILHLKFTAMVCGNMEVEATPETFMDDLYDSKEDKV